ncbi:MAG: glycosyltransferase family 39 protein [Bacteroidetes bacterium]|nr:glycosyltransferase family 39 protein [Bacteroidota bacterium]
MKEKLSNKQWALLFTAGWIVFNLVLSAFTDLAEDEAYYWLFAKFLDWGYFDHPPMIALMIKAGGWLFADELGVRFFTVLFSGLTLYLLFYITEFRRVTLMFLLFLSSPAFHAFGFISAPDVPLMFFGTLYILLFKRFTENDSLKNSLLLGIVVSLMMYSKYHGILLVMFTLLPNLKLLRRKSFWITTAVALLLFVPHIWWQVENDYPSVQYHLVDRVNRNYEFSFTAEYILGQILFCGPILFLLFFRFIKTTSSPFYKTMKWTTVAVFLFFLFFSFRTFIEANWGAVAYVPLILFVHGSIQLDLEKLWKVIASAIVGVLILFRVALMFPNELLNFSVTRQFYHDDEFYPAVQKIAGDLPVVFFNTYQKPSKYYFYSGVPSFSLNSFWYRRNQFDKWPIQRDLQGKKVLLVSTEAFLGAKIFKAKYSDIYYHEQSDFVSYGYIEFLLANKKLEISSQQKLRDTLIVKNIWDKSLHYDTTKVEIGVVVKTKHTEQRFVVAKASEKDLISGGEIPFEIPVILKKGEYQLIFGINSELSLTLWNSSVYELIVK